MFENEIDVLGDCRTRCKGGGVAFCEEGKNHPKKSLTSLMDDPLDVKHDLIVSKHLSS